MAATGSLLPVWVAYFATKTAVRFLHPKGVATSWDDVSLFHNLLSVVVGAYAIWKYGADTASACEAFSDPAAIVIAMQAIHSITDFVVYAKEMLEQPIFIAHHGILVVICFVLPTCPGCAYTTWAMTVGEAGSASIAIDALWRRYGFPSRGLKRVVFFGWSRAFSLYFLYEIMLVTPSQTEFTLSSEGKELLTFNFPVCMMTGVGGTLSMFAVNGTTWFRMYSAYRRHSSGDHAVSPTDRSASPRVASAADTLLYGTLVLGCLILSTASLPREHGLGLLYEVVSPASYGWLAFGAVFLFLAERSTTVASFGFPNANAETAAATGGGGGGAVDAEGAAAATADGGSQSPSKRPRSRSPSLLGRRKGKAA